MVESTSDQAGAAKAKTENGPPLSSIEIAAEGMFISTQQLQTLMGTCDASENLKILDASIKQDGDVYKEFAQQRIPGAQFLDLSLVRNMSQPYPFMMPT